jgi:hypothetical protein
VLTLEIVTQELNRRTSHGNRTLERIGGLIVTKLIAYSSQKAILGNDSFVASVEQHEATSTICVLGITNVEALLTNKGSLLVTKATGNRKSIK